MANDAERDWGEDGICGGKTSLTVIPLLFPQSTVTGVARVIAKMIVGVRSHVDYDGFVHHSCCHFGALGDVTVILLFFGPPLSTVRGVARVIAKVIVGGRSHVDYDGFVDYGCCHLGTWGNVAVILHFFRPVCRPWGGWQGWSRTWSWAVALTLTITTLFTTTVRGNVTLIVNALKNNHCIDQPLTQKSYNIIVSFPRMIWKVFRYQEVQTIFRLRQPYWTIWRP